MKCTVSMRINGRIDIEVEADNPEQAFEKAIERFEFEELDLNRMEIVDSSPVNCSDEDGNLTDY